MDCNYPLAPFSDRPDIPLQASGTPDSLSTEQVFQVTIVQHLQNDRSICESESKSQITRCRPCYDSCQQHNEELGPWTVSFLPESSAICDPSPVNNYSGFELPGNFSALEELNLSENCFVSEPSGIGLPENCSALEELAQGVSMFRHQFGAKAIRPSDDYTDDSDPP